MIQKAQIGRGFRGVLTYVFDESAERGHDRARIVDTNMAGETPRELAAEFGVFRRLNPDLTRAVYHCSLRLPADEALTDGQWGAFSRDYLQAMGFGESPYVVVQHAADHVHIVASRVQFDGRTVPDGNDRWRSNRVVSGLEEKYALSHARDPERERAPQARLSRDEVAMAERRGEIPPKLLLAARIDEAIVRSDGTREGFDQALAALGVTAHWNTASTGRVHGASYAVRDDVEETQGVFKGSQVGRDYGWSRLAERLDARREERAHGRTDDAGTRETGPLATAGPRDGTRTGHDTDSGTPASRSEAPSGGSPVQVVEPTPIIKAIERLHQTIGDEMATVTRFTRVQGEYLAELKRAQNALTSDWYKVTAQVPSVQSAMQQLAQEIRLRQREMEASARLV